MRDEHRDVLRLLGEPEPPVRSVRQALRVYLLHTRAPALRQIDFTTPSARTRPRARRLALVVGTVLHGPKRMLRDGEWVSTGCLALNPNSKSYKQLMDWAATVQGARTKTAGLSGYANRLRRDILPPRLRQAGVLQREEESTESVEIRRRQWLEMHGDVHVCTLSMEAQKKSR